MNDLLNNTILLVLNRNWPASNVRRPQDVFGQMAMKVATGLDSESDSHVRPVTGDERLTLVIRPPDNAVQAVCGSIRVRR